ncbi:MAG TPA: hypothetical protein VMV23_00145 [Candidatus Nanopelagicaceae bacterium]|nr:hypothetical protein [Candidatus Nanopelagicaceae bacterium]
MAASPLDPSRQQFSERLLNQLRSRYPSWDFQPADQGFAISARKEQARLSLSLTTLYQAAAAPGSLAPAEILRFVQAAGPRLSAAEAAPVPEGGVPDPEALVWCVRTQKVISRYPRAGELVTRELPGGLLAFVSEALPGEIMRGVSLKQAAEGGLNEAELVRRSDHNTAVRLQRWEQQLATSPRQGRWIFRHDVLFSSSLLLVPPFLQAVAARGQGSAALLVPDRGTLVAAIGEGAQPQQLRHVARRLYGMADSPLIPYLLLTDGHSLALHPSEAEPRRPWSGWRQLLGMRGW